LIELGSIFQKTLIIIPKKRTVPPGYAFEDTALSGGLKISNSKPACRVSVLHFLVK
jgi:hypothetical protein